MSVDLLVLTLNEVDGIRKIMPQIDQKWVDHIIIVDGGSTDGTVEESKKQFIVEGTDVVAVPGALRIP